MCSSDLGVMVHGLVGAAKRAQTQGGSPPIIAVGDLPYLVNAKIGQYLLKLLMTLVGLFGFILTVAPATGIANASPLNMFLLGYSLDSVVELLGASIEQQASAQVGEIKKQLGLAEK